MAWRRRYRRSGRRRRRRSTWKLAARREVGERIGTSNAKCKQLFAFAVIPSSTKVRMHNARTLYYAACSTIEHGEGTEKRMRNVVNVRGLRLTMAVQNVHRAPLCVNIAIIHPKMGSNASAVPENNFFRDHGNSRATNFNTDFNSIQFNNAHINSDLYAVLWKTKFILVNPVADLDETAPGPPPQYDGAYYSNKHNSYKTFDKWIPLKRQIRFETDSAADPVDGHVFVVMWIDSLISDVGTAAYGPVLRSTGRTLLYFRETGTV